MSPAAFIMHSMVTDPARQARGLSSPDHPWSVAKLNRNLAAYIDRLGVLWVEGEVTQFSRRPGQMSFFTLRDINSPASMRVSVPREVLSRFEKSGAMISVGDRLNVEGKLSVWETSGSISVRANAIRPVGTGEHLARIEMLKNSLRAEGLFDPRLKKKLPLLPHRVGLIVGRESAAERDVLTVAAKRWPGVQFEVINTPVQGHGTVPKVIAALEKLDADTAVDVIIIARGGGSVEDLLPFSDEDLVRAVSRASTPVVSAIGHEPDNPLVDYVADVRAATPTDAAKRVVPDLAEELQKIDYARTALRNRLHARIDNARRTIAQFRNRPVLADPLRPVKLEIERVERSRDSGLRRITEVHRQHAAKVQSLSSHLNALGPSQTLERGYSIVQVLPRGGEEPQVVTTIEDAPPGSQLRIRVGDGSIAAASIGVTPAPSKTNSPESNTPS